MSAADLTPYRHADRLRKMRTHRKSMTDGMKIVCDSEPVLPGLEEVRRFYDQSLFRKAWDALASLQSAADELDPLGRVLVARLHGQFGFHRTSRRIITRLWRRDRNPPSVVHHFAWQLLEQRGPVHARAFLLKHPVPADGDVLHRANYLQQNAEILARLRDFQRAQAVLAEAAIAAPGFRWVQVTRGRVFTLMDRHEEALANSRASVEIDPDCWHLHAEEAAALVALGRDDEALHCLRVHAPRFEAPALLAQWANLEIELEHWEQAEDALERFEAILPPTPNPAEDPGFLPWAAGRRSDICWMRGDRAGAAAWAVKAGNADSFYGRFAARIAEPPEGARRVVLDVGFTRQHHLTCAPATLATLCRYWGRPEDHLAIADAICYHGTAGHHERDWATEHGWAVREFTLTPSAARALIDRRIPFSLRTVAPGSAHAQAVIGYDDFRGSLLVRDPYERAKNEWVEEASLAEQAPWGPRAIVIVPAEKQALLADVPFGDDDAYDLMYALDRALERHDRAAAAHAAARLKNEHPDHRLAILARLAMATYDQNPGAAASALDAQLARHPSDVNAARLRHDWRASDAPRETRLTEWSATLKSTASHPLLWIEYAREIADDGRRRQEAERWLNRASLRLVSGSAVRLRSQLSWDAGRFDDALEWCRVASCLDEFDESSALAYFRYARVQGRTEEALAWLRLRCERHGNRGSAPAQSLAFALADLDRTDESLDVLEEGLRRRPSDIEHRVHTAAALIQAGRSQRARDILQEGSVGARPSAWHAAMASLEEREKSPAAALSDWEKAAESAPLDITPMKGLLRVVEALSGCDAARQTLLARTARFPHYRPLQRFAAEWLYRISSQVQEELLDGYLRAEPDDAWAWREIAFARIRQANRSGALEAAARAAEIEPRHPAIAVIQAEAELLAGDREGALARVREALREAIDYTYALRLLLDHCHDAASRREALDFVRGEITRQHTNGEAIQLFSELAAPHIAREEILEFLREARAARPDLWRVVNSLADHLARMGQFDEAVTMARQGVDAFPLVEDLRITLATVLHNAGRREEEREAIDAALATDATWAWFHRQRALLLEDRGQLEAAAETLDIFLRRQPRDALARFTRGRLAWKLEDRTGALRLLSTLVEDEPGYSEAWSMLAWIGDQGGDPAAAQRKARELVARWPDQARSWMRLANQLQAPTEFDECCTAYDRALALNPSLVRAVEEKALLLCNAGRIEEALALVTDARWGSPRPPLLRSREAWILRQVGRNEEAIERLERALEDDPTLYEARLWAMDWIPGEAALRHAEELVQQYPNDADAWCALGERRLRHGDPAEARSPLERAQELDPRSRRAFAHLFDRDLAEKLHDEAAERIDRFAAHLGPGAKAGFRMELALAKNDKKDFRRQLQAVLESPEDEPIWFQIAQERLQKDRAVWCDRVFDLVLDSLKGSARNPEAAAFAVDLRRHESARIIRVLRKRPARDEIAKRGYLRIISNYGDIKANHQTASAARKELRRLIDRRRDWFSTDVDLWGKVGYAMLSLGLLEECVAWLQNWREFPAAQPWMVNNLIISQIKRGDGAGARANVQDLLRQPFYDDIVMRSHLLEAVWLHLDGKREEALRHQALANPERLEKGFDTSLLDFSRWLAKFSGARKGTAPLAEDERDEFETLRHSFASFASLSCDLGRAREIRAEAAGTPLTTWGQPRPDVPAPREAFGFNKILLICMGIVILIQIVRACAEVAGR